MDFLFPKKLLLFWSGFPATPSMSRGQKKPVLWQCRVSQMDFSTTALVVLKSSMLNATEEDSLLTVRERVTRPTTAVAEPMREHNCTLCICMYLHVYIRRPAYDREASGIHLRGSPHEWRWKLLPLAVHQRWNNVWRMHHGSVSRCWYEEKDLDAFEFTVNNLLPCIQRFRGRLLVRQQRRYNIWGDDWLGPMPIEWVGCSVTGRCRGGLLQFALLHEWTVSTHPWADSRSRCY